MTDDDETTPHTAGPLASRAGPAVAVACLALGVIGALEMRHMSVAHGNPAPWSFLLVVSMPRWVLLAALLPLALRIGVESTVPRLRPRTIALHLLLFLAISWPHAIVAAWTNGVGSPMSHLFPWTARVIRAWYGTLPTVLSLYGAVLLAAWGLAEARERERRTLRASRLEARLHAARLEALRAKLQPHFLYNTLNGIAALVAGAQPARAVSAIEQLSELLHASLRDDARDEVPVSEEVALAERYLALQRMRFGERLQYSVDVSRDVEACLVPVLLLQPIVENAVVHGLDAGAACLRVAIVAGATANGVELCVENDGASPVTDDASRRRGTRNGVGLAATRARLVGAYGDAASLRLTPRDGGGATVRVLLPRRMAPERAAAFAEAT